MTEPTPAELDRAALDAMRALALAHQTHAPDSPEVEAARQALIDARAARGYPSA